MTSLTASGPQVISMTRSFLAWLLSWNPRMGEAFLMGFAARQAILLRSMETDSSLRAVFSNTVYKALAGEFPLRVWAVFLVIAAFLHFAGLAVDYACGGRKSWKVRLSAVGASCVCWSWVCFSYSQKGFSFNAYSTFLLLICLSLWASFNLWFEHLGDVERDEIETPPPHTRTKDGAL